MTQTVLITGANRGIGLELTRQYLADGWRVFATCRQEADCARLRDEGFASFRLDYEDGESIAAAAGDARSRTGGRLDALFNNGAYAMAGAIEDIPTDAFRAMFEANFFGWHELTRLVIPVMRRHGHGRIVQCSSVLGMAGLRMRGPYVASKFALEGYSDVLRLELAGSGLHVVLIEPGPIRTKIRENAQSHYARWTEKADTPWAGFYKRVVEPRLYAENPPPDRFELGPEAVTAKLIRALEARNPHPRYYVTTPTYMLGYVKRALPTRWLDRVLIKG